MASYDIFLLDGLNQIKLDAEDVDMSTTFSVADIADISVRKDSITKTVLFKGSKNNNQAFGSLFQNNKVTDTNIADKIGFNYNPLRTVDCYVYENGMILLKGSMRVLEIDVTKDGEIIYQTCITGKFIDFKSTIADKELTDLDFSDLVHEFRIENITKSWNQVTSQTVNGVTIQKPVYTPIFQPSPIQGQIPVFVGQYLNGNGYVYPFIDYGIPFNSASTNFTDYASDVSKISVLNFRPAIYVKEYLDRIFQQEEISDFSYEIKGSDDFLHKFNGLIIPNADEDFTTSYNAEGTDKYLIDFKSTTTDSTLDNATLVAWKGGYKLLSIPDNSASELAANIFPFLTNALINGAASDVVFLFNRDVKTNGSFYYKISNINNPYPFPYTLFVQFVTRNEIVNNIDPIQGWKVIQQSTAFSLNANATGQTIEDTITITEQDFKEGQQCALRFYWQSGGTDAFVHITYEIESAELKLPSSDSVPFTTSVRYSPQISVGDNSRTFNYDKIQPTPPKGIKQMDFLKSLINLFNFYVYTKNDNPKHLIFQQYDDFYATATSEYILSNAINWTEKIDYSSGYKIKPNIQIPKNYSFTYKEDSDFVNDNYNKTFGEVYGTFSFNDAFGVTDEKKIELIFSPTPSVQYDGTGRLIPALYSGSNTDKTPTKTNIRILYYNGLISCNQYAISNDDYQNAVWKCVDIQSFTSYPQVSSYYYQNSVPVEDLNFGRPKLYDFPASIDYINASTAYNQNYLNQTTELTNPNIYTVECNAYLNEIDINQLDLKTPVFIDMGDKGQAYFKILSVEYGNNSTPSKVILQKIFLGTES